MSVDYPEDELLDGLDVGPQKPARPAKPASAPQPYVVHHYPLRGILEVVGVIVASTIIGVMGATIWLGPRDQRPTPAPAPPSAVELGRAYAPLLIEAEAKAFDADADALHAGKPFGDANKTAKATFDRERKPAFEKLAGKALTDLIPEGEDIKSQAQRDRLETWHREFAKGLRGAK